MKTLIVALALSMSSCLGLTLAVADEKDTSRCVDASIPKGNVAEHGGKWIGLTQEQWQFLRGIYAMNPSTPAGLPYGDRAALVQFNGSSDGLVFFIDGEKACTPMQIPHELLDILRDVATGEVGHDKEPSL
jgi:hypothetical protein